MDWEAPADGWYVWFGMAVASVAVFGVVLSLPTGAVPDANAAADAVDKVTATSHDATATYDHDAEWVRIGPKQLSLRNDAGTTHASIVFDNMTHARGDEELEAVLEGDDVEKHYDDCDEFAAAVEERREEMSDDGVQWVEAKGQFRVRTITCDEHDVTLVDG